jgi:hypothetical protein
LLRAVDKLEQWLAANERPDDPCQVTRIDLTLFMAAMNKEWKPSTCSLTFRAAAVLRLAGAGGGDRPLPEGAHATTPGA